MGVRDRGGGVRVVGVGGGQEVGGGGGQEVGGGGGQGSGGGGGQGMVWVRGRGASGVGVVGSVVMWWGSWGSSLFFHNLKKLLKYMETIFSNSKNKGECYLF